jgi:hypothetical protein
MTRRKVRRPIWASLSILALTCERASGRVLLVAVEVGSHVVTAIETEMPRGSGLQAVETIFSNHAHKVLGQATTLSEAIELAERYATAWLHSDEAAAACSCGEICQ